MYNISYSVMLPESTTRSVVFIANCSMEDGESRLGNAFPNLISFKRNGFKMIPDRSNGKYMFSFLPSDAHGAGVAVCADTKIEALGKISEVIQEKVVLSEIHENSYGNDGASKTGL